MSELVEHEKTVEAPARVVVPSRHDQAKAARGARLWTWIARVTGLALLAAVLAFGLYLAAANARQRSERADLIAQLDEERAKVDALYEQLRSVGEDPVLCDDLSTAFRFTFSDVSFVDVPGACIP